MCLFLAPGRRTGGSGMGIAARSVEGQSAGDLRPVNELAAAKAAQERLNNR